MRLITPTSGRRPWSIRTLPAHLTGVLPAGYAYSHGFGDDPCMIVNTGDTVEFRRTEHGVELGVLERVAS